MAIPDASITKSIEVATDGFRRTSDPTGAGLAPTAPPAFTTSKTSSTITANITASNGATNYEVRVDAGAAETGLTKTGLSASTTYSFQVKGYNGYGSSDWSTAVNVTTSAAASQSYTPIVAQDYAGETIGGDATVLGWYNATYTDAQTLNSDRSIELIVPSFEVGTCPTIWSDWYFGNRINLPEIVTKGNTLWMRLYLFIPSTFSWGYMWVNDASDEAEYDACAAEHGLSTNGHDGNTTTKWLSMDPDNTNGRAYLNVPAARRVTTDPSGVGYLMLYSEQSHAPAYDYDYVVPTGRWVSMQMAVHLKDDSTGWMRYWEDDTLIAEKLNIQTLAASDTGIQKAGLGNYWNGLHYTDGAAGRDRFYMTDVIYATDMAGYGAPTGTDANGNAYIPTTHTVGGFA